MAQRVQVVLEDDLDGGVAAETVTFALDGVSYEVDLSEEHAAELRDALAVWVGAARRVGGRKSTKRAAAPSGETTAIREWALQQGMQVSARGRISAEIREAYRAAH